MDWRFTCGPMVAPDHYTAVRFYVDYEENINWAEFGGLFLYKEQYGKSFDYDALGNPTETKVGNQRLSALTYSESLRRMRGYLSRTMQLGTR